MSTKQNTFKVESYTVPELQKPVRLSDFTAGMFCTIPSRKGMKKAIGKGLVRINGKRAYTADLLKGGELVELFRPEDDKKKPIIDIPIQVLYQDDFLAIIHKPPGIEVSGYRKWNLENALPGKLVGSTQADALKRAEAIHRLDYPTSGTLLIGKTRIAVMKLNQLFEQRQVHKVYMAVTIGTMQNNGIVEQEVDGKHAKSEYAVVDRVASEKYGQFNLVRLTLHTGRRHQLRKHMAHIGNPILGDLQYGVDGLLLKGKGLYLHASQLGFTHPFTHEEICITSPLPKKYLKLFPQYQGETQSTPPVP